MERDESKVGERRRARMERERKEMKEGWRKSG